MTIRLRASENVGLSRRRVKVQCPACGWYVDRRVRAEVPIFGLCRCGAAFVRASTQQDRRDALAARELLEQNA